MELVPFRAAGSVVKCASDGKEVEFGEASFREARVGGEAEAGAEAGGVAESSGTGEAVDADGFGCGTGEEGIRGVSGDAGGWWASEGGDGDLFQH